MKVISLFNFRSSVEAVEVALGFLTESIGPNRTEPSIVEFGYCSVMKNKPIGRCFKNVRLVSRFGSVHDIRSVNRNLIYLYIPLINLICRLNPKKPNQSLFFPLKPVPSLRQFSTPVISSSSFDSHIFLTTR